MSEPISILTVTAYHVAMESRPPLQIDMSGPTATTYSPRNKPLYETNAPAYSFGRKDAEKGEHILDVSFNDVVAMIFSGNHHPPSI